MISSGDSHVGKINPECRERFSEYVKTSWDFFTENVQQIKNVALDKNMAHPKHSGKIAEGLNITVNAAGTIAGRNISENYGIPKG